MAILKFAHLCEYGFITNTGLPGIVGIFTGIQSNTLPAIHHSMTVAINIQPNDNKKHTLSIRIVSPLKNEVIKSLEKQIGPAENEAQDLGLLATLTDTKFTEEGRHEIIISLDGEKLGSLPLDINIGVKKEK